LIIPDEFSRFPANWELFLFTDAVKDATSGNVKIQKCQYLESGAFPVVDQGQSVFGGFTDDEQAICKSAIPTIVFGDHTRAFKYIEKPFALGADGAKVLEPIAKLNKRFLFHYLKQVRLESAGYSRHYKFLKEVFVPVPPLAEQKRIAAILDKADAIRRKRQQAIQLADDFLRAVFLDMFGDPVTNPKGWDVKKCSEISRQITVGLVIRPASYYVEKGVPAIRSQNIKEVGIDETNFVFFSKENNESVLAKSKVFEGDIVIVRSGQPGKAAVIPKKLNGINAIDVLILRPDNEYFDSNYLAYFINSGAGKNLVMTEERGQIQKHLNVGSLNSAKIPIPPIALQKKFVFVLMQFRNKFSTDNSTKHLELFNSLSQKAFSGNL